MKRIDYLILTLILILFILIILFLKSYKPPKLELDCDKITQNLTKPTKIKTNQDKLKIIHKNKKEMNKVSFKNYFKKLKGKEVEWEVEVEDVSNDNFDFFGLVKGDGVLGIFLHYLFHWTNYPYKVIVKEVGTKDEENIFNDNPRPEIILEKVNRQIAFCLKKGDKIKFQGRIRETYSFSLLSLPIYIIYINEIEFLEIKKTEAKKTEAKKAEDKKAKDKKTEDKK